MMLAMPNANLNNSIDRDQLVSVNNRTRQPNRLFIANRQLQSKIIRNLCCELANIT